MPPFFLFLSLALAVFSPTRANEIPVISTVGEPETAKTLILQLHGCGQTSEDLVEAANWRPLTGEHQLLVAFPDVPNEGVYAGCWDYYGDNHTKEIRHNAYLLDLIDHLLAKHPTLKADEVYLAGLSSGAGQAMVLACLAPRTIAGIFVAAAPALNSEATQTRDPRFTWGPVKESCLELSGGDKSAFQKQIASFIYDPRDYVVHAQHNLANARALIEIYGANVSHENFILSEHEGLDSYGLGVRYFDEQGVRVQVLRQDGLGHNWPSGQSQYEGDFVSQKGVNYPAFIVDFLEQKKSMK